MKANVDRSVVARFSRAGFNELRALLFRRYPDKEWATFGRFGWRETSEGLTLTLASLDPPIDGDLDADVDHVAIREPYSLRMALSAEKHPLAVAVFHSHPKECRPNPSHVDDDMDSYYADFLSGFAPGRPYVSVILSEMGGDLAVSARVHWNGAWHAVKRFVVEATPVETWVNGMRVVGPPPAPRQLRLASAFGQEAARRLRRATVGVIGAGGTGSAAIEVLARAGVGMLIVVDPDHVEESNLERLHGGISSDASERVPKVVVAARHASAIDSSCMVVPIRGRLPQAQVVDALLGADVVLGCTDKQYSRLALSDISLRYAIPALDCAVSLEGRGGRVTGQVLQLVRFGTTDPCVLCRQMILPARVAQELMPEEEVTRRRKAAAEAIARGEAADPYWRTIPQIDTVGYLTTVAGALAAGYAIGWITGRFDPPFERLQTNLVSPYLDVTDSPSSRRIDCTCGRVLGWADQASVDALISCPSHWEEPEFIKP